MWYFKFSTNFNETYTKIIVVSFTIPSSPLFLPTTTPNDAQSTYFRVHFRDGSRWFATGRTSRKDCRYVCQISWIWIEFFAGQSHSVTDYICTHLLLKIDYVLIGSK